MPEAWRWYNVDHRHSGIRCVSPAQRHAGHGQAIVAARHLLYTEAKRRNLSRWSGNTRDGSGISVVALNPEREAAVSMAAHAQHTQQQAA